CQQGGHQDGERCDLEEDAGTLQHEVPEDMAKFGLVAHELPDLLDKVDDEVHDAQAAQAGRKPTEVLAQEIGHEERHGVPRFSYRRKRRWNSQTMHKTKRASGNQDAETGYRRHGEEQISTMTLRT